MKFNKLIIIILLISVHSYASEKFGLIIAIGDYPAKTGWSSISSVNDVPLIKQSLLNQGFKENNITTLINEQATKNGILKAIALVQTKLKKGDILVIHYSGHGQQIFDDNGDEIDSKDEAVVPYDAFVRYTYNYKGENHLRDDELAGIIVNIRNTLGKDGQLLMLLDSCHSGSATRGGQTRGGEATFAPENWKPSKNETPNGSDMLEAVKLNRQDAAPFVMISGASANELNYEYEGFGSLSFAFSNAMNELGRDFTYRQLFSKISAKMNVISPKQNPTIEGDVDYKLFKGDYVTQQTYYPITSFLEDDIIKIQAGKLQGVFKETTVNILPAGTTKVTPEAIISKGKVVLANYNQSNIQLNKPLKTNNEKDYWVFIDQKSYGDIQLKVYLNEEKTISESLKTKIFSFLKTNALGEVVTDSTKSSISISEFKNSISIKTSIDGRNIYSQTKTNNDYNFKDLTTMLFNYAQGSYIKNLSLKNLDYEFDFRLVPAKRNTTSNKIDYLENNAFTDDTGKFKVNTTSDIVYLEVTNKSSKPLYFSIIEINSKGEIAPFMPNDNCPLNDNERLIPAGKTIILENCYYEFGAPYETLILKGFATPQPINFKPTVQSKGKNSTRGNTNPLENFIGKTFNRTRGSKSTQNNDPIDGYSTEFIYEIVKTK